MNKCKDCKHNKNISCLVCIKDKIYYVGIDFEKRDDKRNKEDIIKIGMGLIERNKVTTVYNNKITLKDIEEYADKVYNCVSG